MRIRAISMVSCIAVGLSACADGSTSRDSSLDQVARFSVAIGGNLDSEPIHSRIQTLRKAGPRPLSYQELAWVLVPALGLQYRLRHGDDPQKCQELLEAIQL